MIRGLLVVMTSLTIVGGIDMYETTYVRETEVTCVEGDLVTFTDQVGNNWDYFFDEGNTYIVGDEVKLVMNTNHTDDIYDDIIVGVVGK